MKPTDHPLNRFFKGPGITFLGGALVVILPFLQRLLYLIGGLYYRRDFTEVIGARGYFYHQLRQGKLVLWDAVQATGIPFPTYLFDLFNPFSLFYTFLLRDGYLRNLPAQWLLTFHCSLGALGAYLLGLSLNLGRTASVVMGVIMGCCGVVVIKSVEPMMVHTFAWAPFVFLFLNRARQRELKREGLWAGVFLGFCFLGGHPQIFYYIGLAVLLYALYGLVVDTEESGAGAAWSRAFQTYLPLTISFLLTSAPQMAHQVASLAWGPSDVMTAADNRLLLIHSQTGSAEFSLLFNFLFPALEGGHGETYFYVGIMPLVLAWVAVLALPFRSEASFWKVLVLTSLILMMGGNLGIHKILVYVLPGFKYFRLPSRWVFLVHLGVLVLAGFGVARLLSVKQAGEFAGFPRVLAIVMGGLLLVMVSLIAVGHLEILPRAGQITVILNSLTGALLFLAATWYVFKRIREGEAGLSLRFFIVAVVVLDLAFYHPSVGINFNIARSNQEFGPDPSAVTKEMEAIAEDLAGLSREKPGRILIGVQGVRTPWERNVSQSAFYRHRVHSFFPIDGYPERLHPLGYWEMVWKLDEMPRAINLLGAQFIERGRAELTVKRSRWDLPGYSQAAVRLNPGEKVSRLALEARVEGLEGKDPGAIVAEVGLVEGNQLKKSWSIALEQFSKGGPLEIPLVEPVSAGEILLASASPQGKIKIEKVLVNGNPVSDTLETTQVRPWLFRNETALSQAFFVSRAAVFKDRNLYLEALYSVDPARCVLFRKTPPSYQAPAQLASDPGGEVKILGWQDEEVRLQVTAGRPGYLVMTQAAYPGWTAWVDGKKTPILKAYGFLTALPIPPGSHQVRFTYREPWVIAGLIISPFWLAGLLLWTFRRKKKDRAT